MMKQNIALLICPQRLKQFIIIVILMMYLNQSISSMQKLLGKGSDWITDSAVDHTITPLSVTSP